MLIGIIATIIAVLAVTAIWLKRSIDKMCDLVAELILMLLFPLYFLKKGEANG